MKKLLLISFMAVMCAVNSFAQTLYSYEGTVKNAYNFWVYVPNTYQEDKAELPLVVFLHGKSLCGTDMSRVRRYGPLSALQYGRKINALILAPQSPGEGWKPKKVNDLVDWTIKNYKVDTNRIYVIGMSLGGYGTLDYAGTYPKRVAAAISLCGGTTLKDCSKLKDVPLWIIHGVDDAAVTVDKSDTVVAVIRNAGGGDQTLRYDRLDSVNHATLARMFYLNQTYEWLFLHSKKDKPRQIKETFDLKEYLPLAYKGLKANSTKIETVNGKDANKSAVVEKPAPNSTTVAKDTAKTAVRTVQETAAKDNSAQEKAAQEKAAQEKLAQEKAAQEKAAKEKAEREAAEKLAAQKKAQAEAAAKKKAAEEAAKKKAAAEAAAKKKAAEEAAKKKAAEEAKKKAEAAKWHTVKSGESQWSIAHKYGISVDQLRKMNKMTDKSVIQPGQKLRIKY